MSYKNTTDLVQDATTYVVNLNRRKSSTIGIVTGAANHAGAVIRLDASWGGDVWKNSISLSDPSAALGAAFVATLTGPSQTANTQDRLFGAEKIRIVRTDANGGVCVVTVNERTN